MAVAQQVHERLHGPGRADQVIERYARHVLEASMAGDAPRMGNGVRQLVFMLLPAGHCAIELVAQHLGVSRRTIHRQLAKEDETSGGVVEEMRGELAVRYVDEGSKPLNEVASLLGFSATSAFSRLVPAEPQDHRADRQRLLRFSDAASTR